MRIVAVADTHTFDADLGQIPEGDVFIHAGDLLRSGGLDELVPVAAWIRQLPHRHKVVIAGNHDWCFATDREAACEVLGDVVYLEDSGATIDGVRFWGSPWQPEFHGWAFNLPRGPAIAERWSLVPAGLDVLITHGPPLGFGDVIGSGDRVGCEDLLQRVRRVVPTLHLFGHIHEDGGLWRDGPTCFANVTTWECERGPTVLDLDPLTRRVAELQVPPRSKRRTL